MWNQMSEWWCKTMHSKAMWPMNGKYTCPDCLREYPVAWESHPAHPEYAQPAPARVEAAPRSFLWSAKLAVNHVVGSLKRFDTM